jgi:hypothetical protein
LRKVLPTLEFIGKKTRGGPVDANQVKGHIFALASHFDSGTVFFTIAPDDVNNPKSFRLAQRTVNNFEFPATVANEEAFLESMLQASNADQEGSIAVCRLLEPEEEIQIESWIPNSRIQSQKGPPN